MTQEVKRRPVREVREKSAPGALNREAVPASSPTLPLRLRWVRFANEVNRNAVAAVTAADSSRMLRDNPFRVRLIVLRIPRVEATLGFETQPLWG